MTGTTGRRYVKEGVGSGWSWSRCYVHFAAAYGTFWLLIMVAAVIGQTHIDAGLFGMIGFPIIAGVYAVIRTNQPTAEGEELTRLRRQIERMERDASSASV